MHFHFSHGQRHPGKVKEFGLTKLPAWDASSGDGVHPLNREMLLPFESHQVNRFHPT